MINHIKQIGKYVKVAYPEENTIDAALNSIEGNSIKSVLEIDVTERGIEDRVRDFYKDVVKDALFFQAGNGFLGGGVRLDFYKDKDGTDKGAKKVKLACDFCGVENRYDEIKSTIESFIDEKGKDAFVIIKINGKTPRQLFEDKFVDKMYSTIYKKLDNKQVCHLCGKHEKGFNTTTFKFYTNDKSIYGNVNNDDKSGFAVCRECLDDIILGRQYCDKYLSTYWMNYSVMFLPHNYDKTAAEIYETSALDEKMEQTKFLNNIRINEEDVIDEIGKTNSVTDIIFYKEDSKFFNIYHSIQSVLPSRFTLIADLLNKYKLKLFMIFNYVSAVKVSLYNVETTDKERLRVLDSIFNGKSIDRNLFFKRVMEVYKYHYLKDEHKKYACAKTIGKIYNFLCECGCMEKGWSIMQSYKSYDELFENNQKYFDSNEKRAWFILGKAYDTMIYYIGSQKNDSKEEQEGSKTSLEKNFFFARKFDFRDFIYFCNLLEDKAIKYNKANVFFKRKMSQAKELMANREDKLGFDEAKYLFFWGMDSYFGVEKDNSETKEEMKGE